MHQMRRSVLHVYNQTRAAVLVKHGRVADSFWQRMRGLIGRRTFLQGDGLLIAPCNSVHTHFMALAIDVVYLDHSNCIIDLTPNLVPWRFARPRRRARSVLEIPSGTLARTGCMVGDQLTVHKKIQA